MASLFASLKSTVSGNIKTTRSVEHIINFYEDRFLSSVTLYSSILLQEKLSFFKNPTTDGFTILSPMNGFKNIFVKCSMRLFTESFNSGFSSYFKDNKTKEYILSIPVDLIHRDVSHPLAVPINKCFSAILFGLREQDLSFDYPLYEIDHKKDLLEFCRVYLGPSLSKVLKGVSGKGQHRALSRYNEGHELLFKDNIFSGLIFHVEDSEIKLIFG